MTHTHTAGATPLCSSEEVRYLFEATVQVELPPVQMVGVEGKIIVLAAVARVGQNVTAAFREAEEDVTETNETEEEEISGRARTACGKGANTFNTWSIFHVAYQS